MTPIFTDDYYVFDYETAGLPNAGRNFRPLEIGALRFVGGRATVRTFLVNPFADDPQFAIDPGAEAVHHISADMVKTAGVAPDDATGRLLALLDGDLPIWTHNGTQFDFPLLRAECARGRRTAPTVVRQRDSAALYKGRKLGLRPDDFRDFNEFAETALSTRRRGLFFNLPLLVRELPLGIRQTEQGVDVDYDRLGLDPTEVDPLLRAGAHRTGFDVIATHALVQWLRTNPD